MAVMGHCISHVVCVAIIITGSVKIEYFFLPILSTHLFGKLVGRVLIATNTDFARVQLSIRCLELFVAFVTTSVQNQSSFRPTG